MGDTPLLKELVAIYSQVVKGVLQQKPLLLFGLVLVQESLVCLEHQLAVSLVELVVLHAIVLLEELFVGILELGTILLVQ